MRRSLSDPNLTVLLADLGGTSTRFALHRGNGPEHVTVMANDDVPGPAAAIARFLSATGARPEFGVLAVAGPIDGETIALTNRNWRFRLGELKAQFGFTELCVVNDFEAVAWAVPGLKADHLRPIGLAGLPGSGPRLVCGPGTGLGVAALIPDGGRWRVVASEGGHASFGPATADEEPIFARLRDAVGAVSAERVLSGPGLVRLYGAVNPGAPALRAEEVVARAHAGDEAAHATVRLFVRLLGRFAGDMALVFKATGAVYLTGGVACALAGLLDAREFRRAFEGHPPHRSLLSRIPTLLITHAEPGLLGCSVVAERMIEGARLTA
jgi:glucokinase